MKKHKNLYVSFGKLSEEDRKWDIDFWQSTSVKKRFLAASSLAKHAYSIKYGKKLSMKIDKKEILRGKIQYD